MSRGNVHTENEEKAPLVNLLNIHSAIASYASGKSNTLESRPADLERRNGNVERSRTLLRSSRSEMCRRQDV